MNRPKKRKLVYIDSQSVGTMSSYDFHLLSSLDKEQFKIYYICNSNFEYRTDIKDINLILLYNYTKFKGIKKAISYFISQLKLVSIIFNLKPSIIHVQWLRVFKFDLIILKIIRFISHSKLIYTAHNVLPHDTNNKYLNVFSLIYNFFDSIIVHTPSSKEEIINLFKIKPDKIHVIQHGITKLKLSDNFNSTFKIIKNKLPKNKVIVSFLGNLSFYKGLEITLEAIEILNQSTNFFHFIIAGKDNGINLEKLNRINKKSKNTTIEVKTLTNDEFQSYLLLSDFLLLPYIKISQSGLLLSAIEEEKPVIVNKLSGLIEPFDVEKIGFIMKHYTSTELVKIISKLNFKSILYFKKNTNWSVLKEYYSWSRIGLKTMELYLKYEN